MSERMDNFSAICASSDEFVAYLYDEMAAADREVFELHLADCDNCTAQFADISFARLDVYEWNRDEFSLMETPRIVIPYGETARTNWYESVKAFFSFPARLATAGAAFAAVALALGLWTMTGSTSELAQHQPDAKPEVIAPAVTAETGTASLSIVSPADQTPRSGDIAAAERRPRSARADAGQTKPVQVKAVRAAKAVSPSLSAVKRAAPRLNDFEDEDDNTLRLGDLLAEVDTRE